MAKGKKDKGQDKAAASKVTVRRPGEGKDGRATFTSPAGQEPLTLGNERVLSRLLSRCAGIVNPCYLTPVRHHGK